MYLDQNFLFDDVRFKNDMNETVLKLIALKAHIIQVKNRNGNRHRPGIKGGYFPVPPVDSAQDMKVVSKSFKR